MNKIILLTLKQANIQKQNVVTNILFWIISTWEIGSCIFTMKKSRSTHNSFKIVLPTERRVMLQGAKAGGGVKRSFTFYSVCFCLFA